MNRDLDHENIFFRNAHLSAQFTAVLLTFFVGYDFPSPNTNSELFKFNNTSIYMIYVHTQYVS